MDMLNLPKFSYQQEHTAWTCKSGIQAACSKHCGKPSKSEADVQRCPSPGLTQTPQSSVSFLHMTDCHAQLKHSDFREPSFNLGLGAMHVRAPHLVGEALL